MNSIVLGIVFIGLLILIIKKFSTKKHLEFSAELHATYVNEPAKKKDYSCPHCGNEIQNPGRKKKKICPICSREYVRVYTEENNLEKLYSSKEGNALLKRKRDIEWPKLNQDSIKYAASGHWGLYRNCRYRMAHLQLEDGNHIEFLKIFLDVIYLDKNGPTNSGSAIEVSNGILDAFEPKYGMIAPGFVREVLKTMNSEKLKIEDVEMIFKNNPYSLKVKLPIGKNECWNELFKEINKIRKDIA